MWISNRNYELLLGMFERLMKRVDALERDRIIFVPTREKRMQVDVDGNMKINCIAIPIGKVTELLVEAMNLELTERGEQIDGFTISSSGFYAGLTYQNPKLVPKKE